jgi:hypothetical protein
MASSSSTSLLPSEPEQWRPNTRPKLPPDALLDIDQGPLYDIFTEWLHIEDVCHLDSALCNKRRRPEFLELVATKVLLFNREEIQVLEPISTHRALRAAALNWVLKRGIHLASLRLPDNGRSAAEEQSLRDAVASLALNGRLDKLETISLASCSYIKDADLAGILSKCYRSAKSIDIRYCRLTESAAVHIKRCTKLEALAAKGNESAADMAEIVQSCRKLRKISFVNFGTSLTDEVVQSVAAHCPLLEHLNIGGCSVVSDTAIRTVAESCPLLQFVILQGTNIADATVASLSERCPLLKRMNLGFCPNLTDAAILVVAERLPGITHIDLMCLVAITSSAVETLASKCRELEIINLGYCPNVSDVTLMKIAEHCSKLEVLYVTRCGNITTAGLTEIATKCSKLKTVRVSNYDNRASLQQMFPHVCWL